MSGETLFPWWLWLLAVLWTSALVGHRLLPATSDWKQPLLVSIGVYTALLMFASLRCVQLGTDWSSLPGLTQALFWTTAAVTIAGAMGTVVAARPQQRFWHAACFVGMAGIAALLEAYELMLLVIAVGQLSGMNREDNAVAAQPVSNGWLIIAAASLICVIGIGLVQYGFRWERLHVIASRWYTALPDRAAAAKWRTLVGGHSPLFTASGLLMTAVLLWMQVRRQPASGSRDISSTTDLVSESPSVTEPT